MCNWEYLVLANEELACVSDFEANIPIETSAGILEILYVIS